MNAAARAISETKLFSGHWSETRLSKQSITIIFLLVSILATALTVVYVINEYRLSLSNLEQLEQHTHHLQVQWGRLLLEQASLSTPERIGQEAVRTLNMHLPLDKQTFVLQAQ